MRKQKNQPIIAEPAKEEPWPGDRVAFRLSPKRGEPVEDYAGVVTCVPASSPFECYHVRTDEGEEWFVLEREINGILSTSS